MTFAELTQKLNASKYRRTVLAHIIEHLDSEFMSATGEKPKKALLTEEKVLVPGDAFEDVLQELSVTVKQLKDEETKLLSSEVALQPPAEVTPTQSEAQS